MTGHVGIRALPKGGFGNRILAFLTLRQIAEYFGSRYYSVNKVDRRRIKRIHRPPFSILPNRQSVFRGTELLDEGIRAELGTLLARGETVWLKPPILGEAYVRWNFINARNLVHHSMKQCANHHRELATRSVVAIHFRGTDFSQWNRAALMPPSYYVDAVDEIADLEGPSLVRICTDDPSHGTVVALRQHFSSRKQLAPDVLCLQPFECDFATLAGARFLISSPSTFAIVAGLLGTPQIVHNRKWVEARVSAGEEFWRQVQSGSFLGYPIASLV